MAPRGRSDLPAGGGARRRCSVGSACQVRNRRERAVAACASKGMGSAARDRPCCRRGFPDRGGRGAGRLGPPESRGSWTAVASVDAARPGSISRKADVAGERWMSAPVCPPEAHASRVRAASAALSCAGSVGPGTGVGLPARSKFRPRGQPSSCPRRCSPSRCASRNGRRADLRTDEAAAEHPAGDRVRGCLMWCCTTAQARRNRCRDPPDLSNVPVEAVNTKSD